MDGDRQTQKGGTDSTNIQARVVNIGSNFTYSDLKEIALDVYKQNAIELGEVAANAAQDRVENLVDDFIRNLSTKNPDGVQSMASPDMQYSLFAASRDYARSGLDEHKAALSNLLVEKTRLDESSVESIAVSEAIEAVRKISLAGLDTLTAIFVLTKMRNTAIITMPDTVLWFQHTVFPWTDKVAVSESTIDSLSHAGCVRLDSFRHYIVYKLIVGKNPDAFRRLVPSSGIDSEIRDALVGRSFATMNATDETVSVSLGNTNPDFASLAGFLDMPGRETEIERAVDSTLTPEPELRPMLREMDERFENLFEKFDSESLRSAFITNVGVAVAHANWATFAGSDAPPLSVWLS